MLKSDKFFVGIFKEGGVKVNIIPERAVLEVTVRAPTDRMKATLKQKVVECFKAAAIATGCEVGTSSIACIQHEYCDYIFLHSR